MVEDMDGVDRHLMMDHIIKENGLMMLRVEKVCLYRVMEVDMKDNSKMIEVMAEVNLYLLIRDWYIKGNFKLICKMVMAHRQK